MQKHLETSFYNSIENDDYGRRLVLRSEWHDDFLAYMIQEGIKSLTLNYALGFQGNTIDFLSRLPFLESLHLLVYDFRDISVIETLHSLRDLNIGSRDNTSLDFLQFPELEKCGLNWRKNSETLFQCKQLKWLFIDKYSAKDTAGFSNLAKLEHLDLASSLLDDLQGLGALKELKMLGLYNLRWIASLRGLETLINLEELYIESCRNLTSIEEICCLSQLKVLTFNNCGDIASLKPITALHHLRKVSFAESTNILDGDLLPIAQLDHPLLVMFKNRKHYSHRREIFPPWSEGK